MSARNPSDLNAIADGVHTPVMQRRWRRDRRDPDSRERLATRVTAEFREMPGLRLTAPQAQRLMALRSDVCTRLLGELVRAGIIRVDADGRYAVCAT